jgi:hypothetical protein
MSLALVATVGAADANAYADVAAATAVAAYRVGGEAAAWLALTADQKIQSLVTATRDIDTVTFKGTRASTTQALEWPRTGTAYGSTVLPAPLVQATIEPAFSYAPAFAVGADIDPLAPDESAGRIKREKTAELETEWFAPGTTAPYNELARYPSIVQRLLAPLVWIAATGGWGSAVVTRGS